MYDDNTSKHTLTKLFRKLVLGRTLFSCKYSLDHELHTLVNIDEHEKEEIVRTHIAQALAEHITKQHKSDIIKSVNLDRNSIDFDCQLMILRLADFKYIVEAAIQMLPENQINIIRHGKS